MPLGPGTRLGPYEIVSAIGAGGMGEVYRATDTSLGRQVAIKVLPEAFAQDPERLARFEREAKTLAALNHPHIAQIYGLERSSGTQALVIELVEGDTLADLIARGPIPVDEALPIAKQIAEALEAAHEQGIIHRDLKPANIKLTTNGRVKVLDFGLAKLAEMASGHSTTGGLSLSPTITSPALMTGVGLLLGTAAYMSPEQAAGKAVDKRSDLWAFGVVMLEMLTGRQAFSGETVSHVIASVLKDEPAWTTLPPGTPAPIRRLLRRCLEKDRTRRLESVADASLEIDDALAAPAEEASPTGALSPPARSFVPAIVASVLVTAVVAAATWLVTRPSPSMPASPTRLTITLPPALRLTPFGFDRDIAFAPDGSFLIYRAGGQGQLAMRRLDRLDVSPLSDVTNARQPFVSPDGRWVGYVEQIGFTLMKIAVSGGGPIALARLPLSPRGATWMDDGTIIVATSSPTVGLLRVPAGGGESTTLTTPDRAHGELGHWWPSVLPGGRAVLFTIEAESPQNAQIAVLDLQTGQHKTLLRGGSDARYVTSGHLVYTSGQALYAVAFDPVQLTVMGDPMRVVEGVSVSSLGAAGATVTQAGTLAYVPRGAGDATLRSLVWVDRQGHETSLPAPARAFVSLRLSPDGTRVVVNTYDQESDLWVWDLARKTLTRLTFDPGIDLGPVWTPDGRRVLFASNRAGAYNPYVRAADGTGVDVPLSASPNPTYPISVTRDGAFVLGNEFRSRTAYDLMRTPLDKGAVRSGTDTAAVETLLATPAAEVNPEVSPGGNFVAYQSDESGRFEIYVRPYPQLSNGRWQVSTGGGTMPVWTRDGKELIYLDAATHLTAAPVETTGSTFHAGTPTTLVSTAYATPDSNRSYDVSPDGQRFLVIKEGGTGNETAVPAGLVVVQNWSEELKRLVPTK
jgi:eukaryotic-like serine/threonine-protein kinase